MRSRIWVAILLAAFGWGTGGVANRAALLEGVDAFTIIALRMVMAATLLFAYLWLVGDRPTRRPAIWLRGAILGVAGMALPMIVFTLALNHISAGLAGIIIALTAIATVIWAHFILEGERLDTRVIGGMLLGLSGVVTLLMAGDTGIAGGNLVRGGVLALIGVVMTGFTSAMSRKYMLRYTIFDLAGPEFASGAAIGLLAWPLFGTLDLGGLTIEAWLLIAYLGLAGTVLPFLAFLWASQLASATRVAVVGYLVPLISLTAGIVFLDERVTWMMALGGGLIVTGALIVDRVEATRGTEASEAQESARGRPR
jgi:drug/metabolite transporter (DMT)-like permease